MSRERDRRPGSRRLREATLKLLYACETSATSPADLAEVFWKLAHEHDLKRLAKARHAALRQLEGRRIKVMEAIERHGEQVITALRTEPQADASRETWIRIRQGLEAAGSRLADIDKALHDAGDDAVTEALEETLPSAFAAYRKLPGLIGQLEDAILHLTAIRNALEPLTGTFARIRGLAQLAAAIEEPQTGNEAESSTTQDTVRSLGKRQARISSEQSDCQALAEEIWRHLGEIDPTIAAAATNYRLERIDTIDRCILRLAIHEMLYREDIPPLVAIDEAIELAKVYGSTGSAAFVNGILDRVLKDRDGKAGSPRPVRG